MLKYCWKCGCFVSISRNGMNAAFCIFKIKINVLQLRVENFIYLLLTEHNNFQVKRNLHFLNLLKLIHPLTYLYAFFIIYTSNHFNTHFWYFWIFTLINTNVSKYFNHSFSNTDSSILQ